MKKYLSLLLISSALLLFHSCGTRPPVASTPTNTPVASDISKFEEDILSRINEYRRSKGLSPFKLNNIITAEAEKHSQQMASGKTSFGHEGFDGRVSRISSQIGAARKSAENVAIGSKSPEEVVRGWLNSPGHRQNIEGDFTLTGIGVARNKKGVLYYTQMFIKL